MIRPSLLILWPGRSKSILIKFSKEGFLKMFFACEKSISAFFMLGPGQPTPPTPWHPLVRLYRVHRGVVKNFD